VRIYFTFFLVLILIAIAFIFGSQNEQIISLNYLVAKVDLSVAAAVSLFTTIGFLLGLLATLLWRLIRKSKKSLAKKRSTEV
jgi:putative membrane protein